MSETSAADLEAAVTAMGVQWRDRVLARSKVRLILAGASTLLADEEFMDAYVMGVLAGFIEGGLVLHEAGILTEDAVATAAQPPPPTEAVVAVRDERGVR